MAVLDAAGEIKPDRAYPTLMNLLPMGLKGLAFAALTAAIVASLAGKCNSIATIFSLDITKNSCAQRLVKNKPFGLDDWQFGGHSLLLCASHHNCGNWSKPTNSFRNIPIT